MVKNTLRKKLYRDMSRAAMQFLSIIALCALGTFAFAALDGTCLLYTSFSFIHHASWLVRG